MEVNELTDPLGLVGLHGVILVSKGLHEKKNSIVKMSYNTGHPFM
jgi:hypothetical protein